MASSVGQFASSQTRQRNSFTELRTRRDSRRIQISRIGRNTLAIPARIFCRVPCRVPPIRITVPCIFIARSSGGHGEGHRPATTACPKSATRSLMHCSKMAPVSPYMVMADYLWLVRGNTILNSVNSPGSVSTSMRPPCCFTTMSWLIERPSPVPSPAGLVIKNGLNIFSFTSSGMPVPLSEYGFRPYHRDSSSRRKASA